MISDQVPAPIVAPLEQDPALDAFRARVRAWLSEHTPRVEASESHRGRYDRDAERAAVLRARQVRAALYDAGLSGLTWPTEYGGQGLTSEYQRAFMEEAAGFEVGTQFFNIAFGMVGPTILQLGSEAQKATYLPRMLRGDDTWCQLFSEPGAGSDVASLQTRAVRDGDEWVIRGQKVWTSGAHRADYGALLARTDPELPKHQGLTMFVLDMKSPGVTVRPLRQITGEAQFNEVFLDSVRVPGQNVIGEVNGGWHAAVSMLMNERVAIGSAGGGNDVTAGSYTMLLELARQRDATRDPIARQRLAEVYSLVRVLGFVRARTQAAIRSGRTPGPEGSIAKLLSAQVLERSTATAGFLAGAAGQAWPPDREDGDTWARRAMFPFVITIGGGTNEIQRNIVAERVLGLPKEPQVDRDVAFSQLKVGTQPV